MGLQLLMTGNPNGKSSSAHPGARSTSFPAFQLSTVARDGGLANRALTGLLNPATPAHPTIDLGMGSTQADTQSEPTGHHHGKHGSKSKLVLFHLSLQRRWACAQRQPHTNTLSHDFAGTVCYRVFIQAEEPGRQRRRFAELAVQFLLELEL